MKREDTRMENRRKAGQGTIPKARKGGVSSVYSSEASEFDLNPGPVMG